MYQHTRLTTNNFSFFQKFKNFDYILLTCILLLGLISLATMYSTDGGKILFHTKSHFTKLIVFTVMMLFFSFINIKYWFALGYLSYLVVIGLLVWTYLFGITSSGSQRWINLYFINLQPSELMKIVIILCLAKYFHRMKLENVNSIYTILTSLIIILLPMGLVIVQPDLGTSLLIAISGIAVLWFAGINHKYFIYTILGFVISLPFIIAFLKPYQKLRVLTFLNPDKDPLGAGYQIIQSKIAIGSGGLFGKGYLLGSQSRLDYLPEKHTDFIFTLISEELGFFGSMTIILIFCVLIASIVKISFTVDTLFSKVIVFGVGLLIFVFITINMSMVLGLLPIVGSPLPIMSYGGSSMLATMIGFGIVMSAKVHSQQLIA